MLGYLHYLVLISLLFMLVSECAEIRGQYMSQTPESWDADWKAGNWDYMDKVAVERAKMAVIGGVLIQSYAPSDARVLDVGCGEGPLSDFLNEQQKPKYVGVDVAKAAITSAKNLRGSPRKFVVSTAHEFAPKNKFDVIVFSDMLYYVDYVKVIKQYMSYLNPKGVIIIAIYHQNSNQQDTTSKIFKFAQSVLNVVDDMDIHGNTQQSKTGPRRRTSFHIEVYKLK